MASKSRTLWNLMEGQRLLYSAAVAALLVGVIFLYVPPLIVRASIDTLLTPNAPTNTPINALVLSILRAISGTSLTANLIASCVLILLDTALSGAFMYLKGRWAAFACESIAKRLRERLYDHLQYLPFSYHDKPQTGDL